MSGAAHGHEGEQPRRWLVLLAMTGSLSMIFVDMTVVGIALPSIGGALHMTEAQQTWIVTSYLLALASAVALGGRLGDLLGKVPAFIAGVAGFAGASLLCGFAQDGTTLLAGRVLQGLSACLMQPASMALVVGAFAPGERGKAMAMYVGIPLLFMAVGPVLGGLVVEWVGWRWIFWINLPIAAVAMVLTQVARPRDARSHDRAIDWPGGVLLVTGLPLFVYGLQETGTVRADGEVSFGESRTLAALLVGAALLGFFIRRQWTIERPLLRLRLFSDRAIFAAAFIIGCMQFAMTGLVIAGSVYAQEVLGYEPARAGASLLPMLAPVILVVHVAGRWYDRAGVRAPVSWGTALCTVGLLVQALGVWQQQYPTMAVGMAILGTGIAFTMSPTNTDALSRVPHADRGQVSGLVQTLRQVGGSVGVALIAASVAVAQHQLERSEASIAHSDLVAVREALRSKDAQAHERALQHPQLAQMRSIVAGSFAVGYVVAALGTAAAFVVARRMLPRGHAHGHAPGTHHRPPVTPDVG
ncbi:MAG: MFS transporter [Phycisphaerales bacterium]